MKGEPNLNLTGEEPERLNFWSLGTGTGNRQMSLTLHVDSPSHSHSLALEHLRREKCQKQRVLKCRWR